MTFKLKPFDGRQRARVKSGAAAEELVEALNLQCAVAGVAWLRKVPTAFKVVGAYEGGQKVVPEKKTGVDFVGHVAGGRAAYVEVKRVTTARFQLSRVEPHQHSELTLAAVSGCIAVLLLVYGPYREVYALPWKDVMARKSLGPKDIAPYKVPAGVPYLKRFLKA